MNETGCAVCGIKLIKQEIGKDGLPNPKQEEPDESLPKWKKDKFRQLNHQNFPSIWSCPVHGINYK